MENLKFDSWLPLFVGFYNSFLDGDGELDTDLQELNCNYDDLQLDYNQYQIDVSKWYVDTVNELIKSELGIDCKITYQSLYSPKEYNFSTDSINVEYEFTKESLNQLNVAINNHYEDLKEIIREKYTGCSGYIPYYSKYIADWQKETNDFTDFSQETTGNQHYLGQILQSLLELVIEQDTMMWKFYDDCQYHLTSYITNYDELEEKKNKASQTA